MKLLLTGRALFRGLGGNVAAVQCRMNSSNVSVDVNDKTGKSKTSKETSIRPELAGDVL